MISGHVMDTGKMTFLDEDLFHSGKMPKERFGETAPWFPELLAVKLRVEQMFNRPFHTGVCIYYPDGNAGVDYHYDPPSFGDTSVVPSLSLGQERVFGLRERKTRHEHKLPLQNGDLVLMGKGCQDLYEHALFVDPSITEPRINITFRTFGYLD